MNVNSFIRKTILTVSAFISLTAYGKVIHNPQFEARKSSVATISEIELGDDATKVKFHVVFRPNWWIQIDNSECIVDSATGEEFCPIGGEGITIGEKCWMPASGDTVFTVIYPPLPPGTEVIDFSPESSWATWGIRLDGKPVEKSSVAASAQPVGGRYVKQPAFFNKGNVRLHGAIKNYDTRLDMDKIAIGLHDIAIGNDFMKFVAVRPDGTFDETFELTSPQTVMLNLNGAIMSVYLEPGNDLQILTDWEKILEVDRMRGLKPRIDDVEFGGSLAEINRALYLGPVPEIVNMSAVAESADPLEAKEQIESRAADLRAAIDRFVKENNISPEVRGHLLRNADAERYMEYLDYVMFRRYLRMDHPDNEVYKAPIPKEFYAAFLPALLEADTALLDADRMTFVLNRLGFGTMDDVLDINSDRLMQPYFYETEMGEAVKEYAGAVEVPFMWQITMSARTGSSIRRYARWHKDSYRATLDSLAAHTVSNPYLTGRLNDLYDSTVNLHPYPLPDTEAGRLMSELIAPYKGKWIIADFWATTCGPCRANIKSSKAFRDANRDNDEFTYLFVTGDMESPKADYDAFLAENLTDDNCVLLKGTEIIGVRDLFGISAIPHYVLFDTEGRVVDPSFTIYDTIPFLKQTGIKYNTPRQPEKE